MTSSTAGLRSWWGQAWAEAVALAAPEPKPRGRSKPRGARVRNLDSKTGEATVEVGTASLIPYEVRIQVAPIPDAAWTAAMESLASSALFAAKLLSGEMPHEVEEKLKETSASLFPGQGQVRVRCNCPAGIGGCRHGALAERALAEAIDRDPFLLFDLRGRPRAQVLAALGVSGEAAAAAAQNGEAPAHVLPDPAIAAVPEVFEDPALFRRPKGDLTAIHFHIAEPESPLLLLTRLGDPPGWRGPPSLLEALGGAVASAAAKAREIAVADPDEKPRSSIDRGF